MTPHAQWPALLSALALISVQAAAAVTANAERGWRGSDCNEEGFVESQIEKCAQPLRRHLGSISFQPPDQFQSFQFWADTFDRHVCRQQLQQQVADVYRCLFDTFHHCLEQFRADTEAQGDYNTRILLHDLEFYLPDPDQTDEALNLFCGVKEVDLRCLEEKETQVHLFLCGYHEYQKILPLVQDTDLLHKHQNVDQMKSAICQLFKDFTTCVVDRMKPPCPQKTVLFFKTLLDFLKPPICQSDGRKTGKANPRKSSVLHDEM